MDAVEGLPVDLPNTPPSNIARADENIKKYIEPTLPTLPSN